MSDKAILEDKKILIVDDEPDILDALEELLSMCDVEKASTFDQAKELLESQDFDLAILDIMGVDGYKLLNMAKRRNITAVMLTAHWKLALVAMIPIPIIAGISLNMARTLRPRFKQMREQFGLVTTVLQENWSPG